MTMPAAESERIRGYLIGQAAKLTIPELVEKVRTDSAALKAAGESVPGNQFDARPAEGDGIIEGGRLPERAADVISGKTRTGLGTSAAYWEAYLAIREPLYERVLQAKGDEHLDVKMTHSWFGEFSWREWFLFMRVHDLDHMRQLQAIAAALS